jgi:hypothetical protein
MVRMGTIKTDEVLKYLGDDNVASGLASPDLFM